MSSAPRLSVSELADLKAAHPVDALIEQRARLGRPNARGVRSGMCLCEPVRGKAPLWANTVSQTWGCLRGGCGGDIFDFLATFDGLSFSAALERLGRNAAVQPRPPDPRAEQARKRRERDELERERSKAWEIWRRARPAAGTLVDAYFRHRGLEPLPSRSIRFSADEPYYAPAGPDTGQSTIIWSGPCLVAAIVGPDRRFMGAHSTWLDPRLATGDLPKDASGKAVILGPDGDPLPSKKMRGAKRGGAIRLNDPRYDCQRIILLIGEGIETTVTGLQACQRHGVAGDRYVAWAAGDLGNLSGGGLGPSEPHPDRPGRWVPSSDPDPDAPGLMPPEWADLVVLLGDGDSDPLATSARLECARRRYEAGGFKTVIAMAPDGADFNDIARRVAAA